MKYLKSFWNILRMDDAFPIWSVIAPCFLTFYIPDWWFIWWLPNVATAVVIFGRCMIAELTSGDCVLCDPAPLWMRLSNFAFITGGYLFTALMVGGLFWPAVLETQFFNDEDE